MTAARILVWRMDTGAAVGSLPLPSNSSVMQRMEARRAARFAASRLGVTCAARETVGKRVLNVTRPEQVRDFPQALRGFGDRVHCCWPGCPQFWWVDSYGGTNPARIDTRNHVRQEHWLCSCGRFFTPDGWSRHRGQVRRMDRLTVHAGPVVRIRLRPIGVAR